MELGQYGLVSLEHQQPEELVVMPSANICEVDNTVDMPAGPGLHAAGSGLCAADPKEFFEGPARFIAGVCYQLKPECCWMQILPQHP